MEGMRRALAAVVVAAGMTAVLAPEASGLPTFARKYQTSCNTCHVAMPKLTAFGESFRLNGYQIPEGDEAYIKEKPVSMGAPAWKRVWPDAVWPGEIPGFGPLSARVISDFKVNPESADASTEFDFPHETELFWAGNLGENVPFFLELEVEEGEVETEGWLGFYDLFGGKLPERLLNLKVGSLLGSELPLTGVARDSLRMGAAHYLIGDWRLPQSDNAFRLRGAHPGVELNGIMNGRFWYGAALVRGEQSEDKDTWAGLRYKIGGTPYDRSAENIDEAISGKASGFWVDNAFEISAFRYSGSTQTAGAAPADVLAAAVDEQVTVDDDFQRSGLGARLTHNNWDLSAAYVLGDNDDPYGWRSAQGVESDAWHMEADYVFKPWFIVQLRYESLNVDMPTDLASPIASPDRSRWVPGLVFQIRPNVKLACEGVIYDEFGASNEAPDGLVARLDVAF